MRAQKEAHNDLSWTASQNSITEDREGSMITVVVFRAKQATGSQYLLTDKSYDNYFFIGNDLD